MRYFILLLASSAALAQAPIWYPSGLNAKALSSKPVCTDTVKVDCVKPLDANGNFSIVATLPTDGIVTHATTALTLTAATHNGRILKFTSADAVTLTVPAGLGAGFSCLIVQRGAGAVTPAAGAGVTIRQRQSLTKTAGQYAIATLACDVADDCILSGDLQ